MSSSLSVGFLSLSPPYLLTVLSSSLGLRISPVAPPAPPSPPDPPEPPDPPDLSASQIYVVVDYISLPMTRSFEPPFAFVPLPLSSPPLSHSPARSSPPSMAPPSPLALFLVSSGCSLFAFKRSFTAVCRLCSGFSPASPFTRFGFGFLIASPMVLLSYSLLDSGITRLIRWNCGPSLVTFVFMNELLVCNALVVQLHILTHCPFAPKVWDLAPPHPTTDLSAISSVSQLLKLSRQSTTLPPTGIHTAHLIPWILWHLWKARNMLVFDNRHTKEEDCILRALLDARAWQEAHSFSHKTLKNPATFSTTLSPLPLIEDFTCYTDAAWNSASLNCGLGWIIKNRDQVIIHQGTAFRPYTPSAIAAEALAVKKALTAASRMEFTSITLFSDSQVLISLLNTETSTNELQGVLHDISLLSNLFTSITFRYVPRRENSLADGLAKSALSSIYVIPS